MFTLRHGRGVSCDESLGGSSRGHVWTASRWQVAFCLMTVWSGAGMCPAFDAAFTVAAGPDGIRDRVPFSLPCSRHSPLGARVVPASVFDRLSSDHQHLANSVATVVA